LTARETEIITALTKGGGKSRNTMGGARRERNHRNSR